MLLCASEQVIISIENTILHKEILLLCTDNNIRHTQNIHIRSTYEKYSCSFWDYRFVYWKYGSSIENVIVHVENIIIDTKNSPNRAQAVFFHMERHSVTWAIWLSMWKTYRTYSCLKELATPKREMPCKEVVKKQRGCPTLRTDEENTNAHCGLRGWFAADQQGQLQSRQQGK